MYQFRVSVTGTCTLQFILLSPLFNVTTVVEERVLIDYAMDKGFVASWPNTYRTDFWENAAKYLQHCASAKRTSYANLCLGQMSGNSAD